MTHSNAIRISLILNYIVFAILLNTVGAVILQVQGTFGVSKSLAALLEGFKDIPIALFSFIVASFLPRLGIKNSMMFALGIVCILTGLMPLIAIEFWYFKLLFAVVGMSFALIKISVFATIGLISDNAAQHSSFMSYLEGFFMVGVLLGNVLFSWFVDDGNPGSYSWMKVYYLISALTLVALILMVVSKLDETKSRTGAKKGKEAFVEMLQLAIKPLVLVFILSAFLFVLIEQSFMTWTPTFYNEVIKVPGSMSIQAGAVLAGSFAFGRLISGWFLRRIHWLRVSLFCLFVVGALIVVNMMLSTEIKVNSAQMNWLNAPLIVYVFPIMGIFLSPIYPTINSVVLSSLPTHQHSSMSGLIVVFSALGGTSGSIITGHLFEKFGGTYAFYFSLIPILAVSLSLLYMHRLSSDGNSKFV